MAELAAGRHVVYIHFEESDPGSTLERPQLIGASHHDLIHRFRFVGPARPACEELIKPLLSPPPTLVVFDGVNEGMALQGVDTKDVEGTSAFRRRLILPFTRVGAATLACDHTPHGGRVAEYGSVHKGNALDGTRINLENEEPFGRRLRGVSHVFVTKDRPGYLRAHGVPTKTPGKTRIGTLVVDDSETRGPDFTLMFFAPKQPEPDAPKDDPAAEVADAIHKVVDALPDRRVDTRDLLYAAMRRAGHKFRNEAMRAMIADLMLDGRFTEITKGRARGYQAVPYPSQESSDPDT